jgi:chorismate lyase / 3-hydroxybenzoate synthase
VADWSVWMANSINSPVIEAGREPGSRDRVAALVPEPPAWATELAEAADQERWRLVSVRIPDASTLSAPALEAAVAAAYGALASALAATGHHPVRFWNFVPGIHADMGDGRDRYMVFNAGRFAAFRDWFGSAALFSRTVPTASAVGIVDGPLVIHGLAGLEAGEPVENPRQVPAYSYSRRYGALPPCFARATRVVDPGAPGVSRLLVGGTASIVGEDSQHERDAREQALETFANLAHLIAAASGTAPEPAGAGALRVFTDMRVYIVRETDATLLREMVRDQVGAHTRVELAQADLCRRELLVEIEGLALI